MQALNILFDMGNMNILSKVTTNEKKHLSVWHIYFFTWSLTDRGNIGSVTNTTTLEERCFADVVSSYCTLKIVHGVFG